MKSLAAPHYIETLEALVALAERLREHRLIAVDTEADSFHHYREKVCLMQISAGGEDSIVDPLALPTLEPLRPILEDPSYVKIFHDAGYDLIGLRRDFGFQLAGLFDTMLASRLLGMRRFGLATILEERYGFVADKRLQRSDWARRPLTGEQIDYARFDTHFLPRLTDELRAELDAKGRLAWAEEDFARLPEQAARVSPREPGGDPDAWWRVKGVKQLSPEAKGRARALFRLRERIAERLDRPPFKVFGDPVLIDLARHPPPPGEPVRPRRGLRRAGVDRFGSEIARVLRDAEPVREKPPAGTGRRRRAGRFLDPEARDRYERLRDVRRRVADELGLEPEVLLANATLEDLARTPPGGQEDLLRIEVLQGWRRPFLVGPIWEAL